MRSSMPALALVTVAVVVACADATSPQAAIRAPGPPSALRGNPPPPPADTGSYASTSQGLFVLRTTYFMNPAGNNGWVHFPNGEQSDGVIISPDASIRYHQGEVSGKGTITAPVGDGIIVIDLSTVNSGKFNGSCDGGCAEIPFTGTFTDKQGSTPSSGAFFIGSTPPTIFPGT